MVDALDPLIPSRTKIFFWVGEDHAPQDFYEREPLVQALDAYFSQTARLAADPDEPSFDKLANSPVAYGGWRRLERLAKWERSILKNEVFGAYNIGNNLDFTIRAANRPIGVLALAREPGSRAYSRNEVEAVLATCGHFAHAMQAPSSLDAARDVSQGDVALVLLGGDDSVVQSAPQADLMLHQMSPRQGTLRLDLTGGPAPMPLREAARRLRAVQRGEAAPAPTLDVMTDWGRIRVVAHSLLPGGETAITLQRFIPRALLRAARLARLDLSPREREVAAAMCGPGDGDAIARAVGLSAASYREYARRIYRRLGLVGRFAVKDLLDG